LVLLKLFSIQVGCWKRIQQKELPMKAAGQSGSDILEQVRSEFSKQKVLNGGQRRKFPLALKDLTVRALNAGLSSRAIAAAAGVSRHSILNWSKEKQLMQDDHSQLQTLSPVELRIVKMRSLGKAKLLASRVNQETQVQLKSEFRIYFKTGAWIECQAAALDLKLVAVLNGEAPCF